MKFPRCDHTKCFAFSAGNMYSYMPRFLGHQSVFDLPPWFSET